MFHADVVKVDRDVAYVASVSEACCKRLFKMFHLFHTYVSNVFYLDIAYVSHLCCMSLFEMFQLFQSYATISVSLLQVANVLFGCSICFTHMLQLYVSSVSYVS